MMADPVVASDGQTYERADIERWFRAPQLPTDSHHPLWASLRLRACRFGICAGNTHQVVADQTAHCTSPLTGEPIDGRLIPNQAIGRQIKAYCQQHALPAPSSKRD